MRNRDFVRMHRRMAKRSKLQVQFDQLESRLLLEGATFAHPGILNTAADFQRIATEVSAGAQPWLSDWNNLQSDGYSHLGVSPRPLQTVVRASTGSNYGQMFGDIRRAYDTALEWKITGNTAYADQTVTFLNAWASTNTSITGDSNAALAFGLYGFQWANIAEMMRGYSGWAAADQTQFKNYLLNVYIPGNQDFLTRHNGTDPTHYWANWDLCNIGSEMAIGVFCDRHDLYQAGLNYLYNGIGNGALDKAIYYMHSGNLGQGQEEGRDQGHSNLDYALLGQICQTAWNQGDDLFSYHNNEILAGVEYLAKYNLGNDVPYELYASSTGGRETTVSTGSRGQLRPIFELFYNHYVTMEGLSAPYTTQALMQHTRPEGDNGNGDEYSWGTLIFALDPLTTVMPPQKLIAHEIGTGSVELDWWGGANDATYNVYRSTSANGTYTKIASGITALDGTTYTDNAALPGKNYYKVTGVSSSGTETAASNIVEATGSTQLLAQYLFDQASGTTATDSIAGGPAATLDGGATWVAGKSGNAIALDGSSGYLSLPANSLANVADFTISTWIYLKSNTPWQRILDFGDSRGDYMFLTPYDSNGKVQFATTTAYEYNKQYIESGVSLPLNTWVNVAVTLSGHVGTLYVDGQPVGTNTQMDFPPDEINGGMPNMWIGRSEFSTDPYLNANIDDFRIYRGAMSATQMETLVRNSGLETQYRFDQSNGAIASDSSGSGQDATLVNGATWSGGKTQNAVTLNGSSQYVSLPSGVISGMSAVTISTWVNLSSLSTWSRIFDFGTGTTVNMFLTPQAGGTNMPRFAITTAGNGGEQHIDSNTAIPLNTWTNVAVTLSGSTGTLYINGVVVGSNANMTLNPASLGVTTNNYIGKSQYSGDPSLQGSTDDFRIYNRALSSTEISSLVSQRADLEFTEISGTTAPDSSSNGFDGTLVNGAAWSSSPTSGGVSLNGSNQYVSLPSGVVNGLTNFSISAWVDLSSQSTWSRIFDFGTGTTVNMFLTPQAGGTNMPRFAITTTGNGGEQRIDSSTAIPLNTWTLVTVTLSGTTGTLYINGAAVGTNSNMTLNPASLGVTTNNYLGKSQFNDPALQGKIGSFRIDDRALSATEVQSLTTASTTNPTIATPAAISANPITSTTSMLSVLGADDGGETNLKYTWWANSAPAGAPAPTFSANGSNASKNVTVTFHQSGNYTFGVLILDANGNWTTSAVSVTINQTFTSISVTPGSSSVASAGNKQFSATAMDQFGNPMASQPAFSWRLSSGGGSISNAGFYMAPYAAGSATVQVTSGSMTGTTSMTITNAAPTVATAASAGSSSVTGATTALSALGADSDGGGESNLSYTWSAAGPAAVTYTANGTNAAKNSTATFTASGTYTFTCTITDAGGLSTTSSATVAVDVLANDADIGAVGQAGSLSFSNGTYTLTGGGADIWGTADAFQYAWNTLSSDGQIVTQVNSASNSDPWAKAGVMFRESSAANSRFIDMFVTAGQGVALQWRSSTGGSCGSSQVAGITAPAWVKLVRSGNAFTGYYSTDGTTWHQVGSTVTIAMNSTIDAGLAVTAHNNATLCTATFSNLSLTPYANLALHQSVSASSTTSGSSAANAVDGNTSIAWTSASAGTQALTLDLGAIHSLSHLQFTWGDNYASAFTIQISMNGTNWTSLYSTASGAGGIFDLTVLATSARYIKLTLTAGNASNYMLNELAIFGL